MIKKSFMLAIMMVFAGGAFAHADCTAEEAQAKAQDFMNAATALAQKDADKYAQVAQAMQEQLPELQQNVNDLNSLCKFYDEWIEKMQ